MSNQTEEDEDEIVPDYRVPLGGLQTEGTRWIAI